MKNKILILIIGILVGAIIATSAFLIYNKLLTKNLQGQATMQTKRNGYMEELHERPGKDGGTRPEMSKGLNDSNL